MVYTKLQHKHQNNITIWLLWFTISGNTATFQVPNVSENYIMRWDEGYVIVSILSLNVALNKQVSKTSSLPQSTYCKN